MQQSLFPIAFPKRPRLNPGARILAVDIGGTKSDLALYEIEGGGIKPSKGYCFFL